MRVLDRVLEVVVVLDVLFELFRGGSHESHLFLRPHQVADQVPMVVQGGALLALDPFWRQLRHVAHDMAAESEAIPGTAVFHVVVPLILVD